MAEPIKPIEDIVESYRSPLKNAIAASQNLDDEVRVGIYRMAQEATGKQIVDWKAIKGDASLVTKMKTFVRDSYSLGNEHNPINPLAGALKTIDNSAVTGAFNNILFGYAGEVSKALEGDNGYEAMKAAQTDGHSRRTVSALALGSASELQKEIDARRNDIVDYFAEKYDLKAGLNDSKYSREKLSDLAQDQQTLARLLIEQLKDEEVKAAIRRTDEGPSPILSPHTLGPAR